MPNEVPTESWIFADEPIMAGHERVNVQIFNWSDRDVQSINLRYNCAFEDETSNFKHHILLTLKDSHMALYVESYNEDDARAMRKRPLPRVIQFKKVVVLGPEDEVTGVRPEVCTYKAGKKKDKNGRLVQTILCLNP